MEANPQVPEPGWHPPSTLIESQGLAVLRDGDRYASLECGTSGGGHGHADRLHLTLHADGIHWLPDPGTGSYVTSDLFWYRSTLAHNAPRLDGADQPRADAQCEGVRDRGSMGLGQRQVRRCDSHRGVGRRIPGGRSRNVRGGESNAGASLAPERSSGADDFGTVGAWQVG